MKKTFAKISIYVFLMSIIVLCGCGKKTPYIGENGNWWIGDSDTGVQAQGEKGD